MNGEFLEALNQIAREKDIPLETLIETVESALATAYKRNHSIDGEVKVRIDSTRHSTSPYKVYMEKTVVEEVENSYEEISLEDAQKHNPEIMVGEMLTLDVDQAAFGRIEAQTAKQVVMQRIREAERRKKIASVRSSSERFRAAKGAMSTSISAKLTDCSRHKSRLMANPTNSMTGFAFMSLKSAIPIKVRKSSSRAHIRV